MKNSTTVLTFVKRNLVYFILALCVIAVGVATTLALVGDSNSAGELNNPPSIDSPEDNLPVEKPEDTTPEIPVVEPISFCMPVASASSVLEYSNTMVFNSTLNRYSSHLAIDFFAPEGTSVLAVYGGTITNVENTLLKGVSITIDHGDGLKTVYNSLADGDMVSVGQKVNKGDVIGQVSTTNRQEYKSGAHLHFEVYENDQVIDPAKYLVFEEK